MVRWSEVNDIDEYNELMTLVNIMSGYYSPSDNTSGEASASRPGWPQVTETTEGKIMAKVECK